MVQFENKSHGHDAPPFDAPASDWLVFADALEERGDKRGHAIVLSYQSLHSENAELLQYALELKNAREAELTTLMSGAQVEWQYGLARALSLRLAEHNIAQFPALLAHSSLEYLESLTVNCERYNSSRERATVEEAVAAIAERPRCLRHLSISEELGDWEPPCRQTEVLWSQLPELKTLELCSERPLFLEVAHNGLEELKLGVDPLRTARWSLPSLTSLDWNPTIESDCDIEVYDELWSLDLPALRKVSLRGYMVTQASTLARQEVTDFLSQLTELTTSSALLVPEGRSCLADELMVHAASIEHLQKITVYGVEDLEEEDYSAVA